MAIKMMSPVFRASYVHVFEPGKDMQGNEYYGLSMIFDKAKLKPEELAAIKKGISDAAAEKFGKDQSKWPRGLKICLRDADQEDRGNPNAPNFDPAYANAYFMNCKSGRQPGVVDEKVQPIISQDEFYSGCYARATIVFHAYDKAGAKGVGCYLNNVMKVADGERLGGSAPASSDFAAFRPEGASEHVDDSFMS